MIESNVQQFNIVSRFLQRDSADIKGLEFGIGMLMENQLESTGRTWKRAQTVDIGRSETS